MFPAAREHGVSKGQRMDETGAERSGKQDDVEAGAFDAQTVLERLGGDVELLQILAREFRSEAAEKLESIRRTVDGGDARGLEAAAHGFKGSISLLDGGETFRLARELELMGRRGDLSEARGTLQLLEEKIQVLLPALEAVARAHEGA